MSKIASFIANKTEGRVYSSYKYCIDSVEVPTVTYDDKKDIRIGKKFGETDKSIKGAKSIQPAANGSLFKYFLDGSRRTYKVDDIVYEQGIYPFIAGQIGVGCCRRNDPNDFKSFVLEQHPVIAIPDVGNIDGNDNELFCNNLLSKLNEDSLLKKRGLSFSAILPYSTSIRDNEKYEHKGIAKIQDKMIELEKKVVHSLVKEGKLEEKSFLLKDGSLEYQRLKDDDPMDWPRIKRHYQFVVGVSKAFNPEALRKHAKDISKVITDLKLFCRTPVYMYEVERISGVKFGVWYLRIRDKKFTIGPYDGIVKVEKVMVTEKEEEQGIDSDEIDLISANIINERNPVCYGQDSRWAKHLYPIFLTESHIKSKYLSDVHFKNLF